MTVWYVPHARDEMGSPSVTRTGYAGRTIAWARIDGRGIIVIYQTDAADGSRTVVTTYPSRRPKA